MAPSSVQVTIAPQSVNLPPGLSQQFTAVVTGSADTRVRWSAEGGSVTADGLYTAPQAEGTWQVTAASVANPDIAAKASVVVAATPVISIALQPLAASVRPGGTLRFSAVVGNSPDPGVLWSVDEPAGGTVDASGIYTAPFAEGTYHLVARSRADPTHAAQATISVSAAQKVTVGISPASAALRAGDKQQFTAAVAGSSDGAVTWSVDAGSIDQSGLYTAPAQAGTAHVTVTSHADPTQSAAAVVTVIAGSSIAVTIDPQSPTVALGASQQFTAHVLGTPDTRVAWSIAEGVAGGSVTVAGLYSPSAAGVWHVVATSVADATAAASTAVTVPNSQVQVTIGPTQLTAAPDQLVKFSAAVTGTTDTRVVWSIDCCGTVAQDGTVTAPHADGIYHVTAQSLADTSKSATATLTVVTPTSVAVTVDPSQVTLSPGQGQAFQATVTGTSDTRVTWSVAESGGGQIDAGGIYTAPSNVVGVFHVVATSVADSSKAARAAVTVAYDDLIDGGGPVSASTRIFALWWGPASEFPADMKPAMESLFSHLDGSTYLSLVNEYMRGATATATFGGSLHDPSDPPATDPSSFVVDDEACASLDAAGIVPKAGDMVFVYTSRFPTVDPTTGGFCAWHGNATCHQVPVLIAFAPNPQGTGCVTNDSGCNSLSEATRSLVVFTGHELAEAMTDPFGHAWKDRNFAEVADKCTSHQGCVNLAGGITFQLQQLYSNAVHACTF